MIHHCVLPCSLLHGLEKTCFIWNALVFKTWMLFWTQRTDNLYLGYACGNMLMYTYQWSCTSLHTLVLKTNMQLLILEIYLAVFPFWPNMQCNSSVISLLAYSQMPYQISHIDPVRWLKVYNWICTFIARVMVGLFNVHSVFLETSLAIVE